MPRKTSQPSMFEKRDASAKITYILTGQGNLLDMLSSGQIKPAAQYKKYYGDPGQHCPNAIPLLLDQPPIEFINQVVLKESGIYPVLIEIELNNLAGNGMLIGEDLEIQPVELPAPLTGRALVIPGVLPARVIRRVHFRTEAELQEFRMRKYANVPEQLPDLSSSPELFEGTEVDVDLFIESLNRAGKRFPAADPGVTRASEGLGGAVLLLARLAVNDERFPLSVLTAIMEFLQSFPDRDTGWKKLLELPDKFRWASCLPVILPEESGGMTPAGINEKLAAPDSETFLFASALHQLARQEPVSYSPDTFIGELIQNLREAKGNENQRKAVSMMERVRMGEVPIEDFARQYSPADNPAIAGIMIFVLRKDPGRVLAASIEEEALNSIDAVGMATMLSGALYGRTLIPIDCQPPAEFKKWSDTRLAGLHNALSGGLRRVADQESVRIAPPENDRTEALKIGETLLLQRVPVRKPRPASKTTGELYERMKKEQTSGTGPLNRGILPAQAEAMRKQMLDADLADSASPDSIKAIEICRKAGWADLVRSKMNLENKDFTMEHHSEKREFRVVGFAALQTELNPGKVEEFKKRLSNLDLRKLQEIL